MDKKTKQKLREGRDSLQDNILPDKYGVIELYDLINELETELHKQTELKEFWKDRYLNENEKLLKLIEEE